VGQRADAGLAAEGENGSRSATDKRQRDHQTEKSSAASGRSHVLGGSFLEWLLGRLQGC
jgi:hypothetical protein